MADPQAGPPEREVMHLRFQQLTRLKIFDDKPETLTPPERCQLLAVSNKYGYTFLGCDSGLKILATEDISKIYVQHQDSPSTVVGNYRCLKVAMNTQPVHLALSTDDLTLSVCSMTYGGLLVALFDVRTLVHKSINALPFATATLSKEADTQLINLLWNPGNMMYFATCLSDGSMALWDCSGDGINLVARLPNEIQPTAICWSPKGKQIVIGTSSGKLIQYNQKLEQKKVVPPPDFSEEPIKVVDILWLSTYLFAVAYIDAEETLHPNLTIVNAPKEGRLTFNNFEDICFGSAELRTAQYQMLNMDIWGFITAASSNSPEVAVIGRSLADNLSWEIWTLDDAARIAMPLSSDDDDTFPMGMALDLTSQSDFTIGTKTYKHPPIIMVLSTDGLLCPFYVLNSDATETITTRVQPLPLEGGRVAIGKAEHAQAIAARPQAPPDTAKPATAFSTPHPIHKSSSTGSFSPSPSTPSALGSAAPGPSDRSFSNPKTTAPTTHGMSTFAPGMPFGKQQSETTSGGSSTPFVSKTGSTSKLDTFSFSLPKVSPANTSLVPAPGASPFPIKVPGAQEMSDTGHPVQQPSSSSLTRPGAPQPFLGQSSDQTRTKIPPTTTSSANLSHQKTISDAASVSGAGLQQQSDSVKASGFLPSMNSTTMGRAPPNQTLPPPQAQFPPQALHPPPPQAAPSSSVSAPPNQVAPSGSSIAPNQIAPGFPQNQMPTRSNFPNQVAPPGQVPRHLPPPYTAQASQPQRQTVPETKPPPSVQTLPTAAGAAGSLRARVSLPRTPVEAAYLSNISAEMEHFNKELAELLNPPLRAHFKVGEHSEHEGIKRNTDHLVRFQADVLLVTKSHNEEIHELKSKLLTTFGQVEDARILKQRNRDPRYLQLLRLRGLDPQTAQQLRTIQSNYHYLETGLGDVNGCLDAQWEEFHQRKSHREGRKLGTPTMDTIYQTLGHHYNIMIAQRGKLEKLRQQLIQARRYDITEAPWERGMLSPPSDRSGDLSSLAAQLATTQITSPVKARGTPVSSKKKAQLRKALSRRATTPRRTACRVDISNIGSPVLSQSYENVCPSLVNHRDDEPIEIPPARRRIPYAVDAPDVRIGSDVIQARPGGGTVELGGLPSHRQEGMRVPFSGGIEPRQTPATSNPALPLTYTEPPPSSTPDIPLTSTSPSNFVDYGRGTVVWGLQTTPTKTPSTTRAPSAVAQRRGAEKQAELPPVVNIKNLDVNQEPVLPPISFAPVNNTVDAGTVKVVNQVLAEITKSSGYGQPVSSRQSVERKISVSDEPPPIVSKPSSIKTAINSGPTFGGSGFMLGARKDGTSAAPPNVTAQGLSTSLPFGGRFGVAQADTLTTSATVTSTQPGLSTSTAAWQSVFAPPVVSGANDSGGSSFSMTTPQQSTSALSLGASGSSAASVAGVKPSPFDLKVQRAGESTSTHGGFTVAPNASVKEPSQDQLPFGTTATTSTPAAPTEARPTPNSGFGVEPVVAVLPPVSAVQPTATAAPAADAGWSAGVSQTSSKQFHGMDLKPVASSGQSGLKQLLAGEDEAGTGLASKPSLSGFGVAAVGQAAGEDEAGTGKPASTFSTSDGKPASSGFGLAAVGQPAGEDGAGTGKPASTSEAEDGATAVAAQHTTAAATATGAGMFSMSALTPVDALADATRGLFGAKTVSTGLFGTATTAATSGSTAGFGAASFGVVPSSAGQFGAPKFGTAPVATGLGSTAPAATTTTTTTATDMSKTKTPSTLFGLLKEDDPVSSSALFASMTTTDGTVSKNLFSQTTSPSSTPFGQSAGASGGLFGQQPPPAPNSGGLFGKPVSTSGGGGLFGQPAGATSSSGMFGQSAAATSSSSIFGQDGTKTSSGGLFGQTSPASASPFQQGGSGGLFGASSTSSTFGQQSTGMFGSSSNTPPSFGQGTSLFGQPTTTTPSSTDMFGGGGGDSGGFFSGLGSRPNPDAARSNPFGSPPVPSTGFTTSTGFATSTAVFGGGGGGFSSPGAGVSTAGFGGFNLQPSASTGGFGSSPSFGSPPGFGSTPAFGGAAFGSTGAGVRSPFGQSSAFGASPSTSQASSGLTGGFSEFASQETPTFGALSTGGANPQQGGYGGFGTGTTQPGYGGFGSSSGAGNPPSSGFSGSSSFTQYR